LSVLFYAAARSSASSVEATTVRDGATTQPTTKSANEANAKISTSSLL